MTMTTTMVRTYDCTTWVLNCLVLFTICLATSKLDDVENGDVRLADGPTQFEGPVEIFFRHQWGTICDDSWSIEDANVVCEQLGYGSAVAAREGAYYGKGVGNITLDEILCNGLEIRLNDCTHGGWFVHNCDHSEDAGVWCDLPSDPIIDLDISPGVIVGGVLHGIVCLIIILACVRYCCISRSRSKRKLRRRPSSSLIEQSAYSVDGHLDNCDLPSYDKCHLFSSHNFDDTGTNAPIFSIRNNISSSFALPSFLNRQRKNSVDEFSVSMLTQLDDTGRQPLPIETGTPPAYDSIVGTLVTNNT